MRMQKKPKKQTSITNALENMEHISLPQEAHKRALHITNEAQSDYYTSLSFSNASSSLEVIQKAQMEQVQRRNYLDILTSQQQRDTRRNTNTRNYMTPYVPRLQDANALDFPSPMILPNSNERQQLKIENAMTPVMLPKNVQVRNISSFPTQSENDKWKTQHAV